MRERKNLNYLFLLEEKLQSKEGKDTWYESRCARRHLIDIVDASDVIQHASTSLSDSLYKVLRHLYVLELHSRDSDVLLIPSDHDLDHRTLLCVGISDSLDLPFCHAFPAENDLHVLCGDDDRGDDARLRPCGRRGGDDGRRGGRGGGGRRLVKVGDEGVVCAAVLGPVGVDILAHVVVEDAQRVVVALVESVAVCVGVLGGAGVRGLDVLGVHLDKLVLGLGDGDALHVAGDVVARAEGVGVAVVVAGAEVPVLELCGDLLAGAVGGAAAVGDAAEALFALEGGEYVIRVVGPLALNVALPALGNAQMTLALAVIAVRREIIGAYIINE